CPGLLISPVEHSHGSVLDSHLHGAFEHLLDLGGRRRGRKIKIVILDTEEVVSNRSPNTPGFEPRILEPLRDVHHFRRDVKLNHRGPNLRSRSESRLSCDERAANREIESDLPHPRRWPPGAAESSSRSPHGRLRRTASPPFPYQPTPGRHS